MTVTVHHGDCLEVMAKLAAEGVQLDSVVTDPPYFLTSIVDRFGAEGAAPAKQGADGRFKRLSGGFMGRKWDAPEMPPIDPAFAHWFAGFADGEGCFHVHKKQVNGCQTYDCQFSITLRADDRDIIAEIQRQMGGAGSIAERKPRGDTSNKTVRYCISSKADCQKLREVFRAFPLRAKKARDFEVWSLALDEWLAHEPGGSWEEMAYFRDYLMVMRRYGSHFNPAQLFFYRFARLAYQLLKPGAHLVAFGGTRTYHRLACAIEDAGFEIRDQIGWVYATGFPKSHDVSKGIDKAAGLKRPRVSGGCGSVVAITTTGLVPGEAVSDEPICDEAMEWQGWGTALKPAWEPIVLARKPLIGTVAANVLEHGTGAINIDASRIPITDDLPNYRTHGSGTVGSGGVYGGGYAGTPTVIANEHAQSVRHNAAGRWPANIIHDGSAEVVAAFPESGSGSGVVNKARAGAQPFNSERGWNSHSMTRDGATAPDDYGDLGSAARFFYSAKADAGDRLESKHPTVKPVDLMVYLCRLITPPGGTVLDPFAGSGTTGMACMREGFNAILVEREAEYVADIQRRIAHVHGTDAPLFAGAAE